MALHKLNVKKIEAAKPREQKYDLPDGGGLYLRIQPVKSAQATTDDTSSSRHRKTLSTELPTRTWYYVYRSPEMAGKQRWWSLGEYPAIPLYDDDFPERGARGKATAARELVGKGVDPQEEAKRIASKLISDRKAEEDRLAREAELPQTIRELFLRWKEKELASRTSDKGTAIRGRRSDNGASIEAQFNKHVFPVIGDVHPMQIDRTHILKVGERIKNFGFKRTANQALSSMRQMFTWGRSWRYCAEDPTSGIRKKDYGGTEKSRERFLSDDEITDLAKKLHQKQTARNTLVRPSQLAVLLQISTLCRVGELVQMEWKNVQLDDSRRFHIPKAIRKNDEHPDHPVDDFDIYLSDFSAKLLIELRRFTGHTAWLFPDMKTRKTKWDGREETKGYSLDEKTITKQVGDRQRTSSLEGRAKNCTALLLSGGKWTPHDLRRTGATLIARLAIQQQFSREDSKTLSERCLSHIDPDKLHTTYNKYGYDDEMRKAWMALGAHLDKLVPAAVLEPAEIKPKKRSPKWKQDEFRAKAQAFGEPVEMLATPASTKRKRTRILSKQPSAEVIPFPSNYDTADEKVR